MFGTANRILGKSSVLLPALRQQFFSTAQSIRFYASSNSTYFCTGDKLDKKIFNKLSKLTVYKGTEEFINSSCFGPREMHFKALVKSLEDKKNPNSTNSDFDTPLHLLGKAASECRTKRLDHEKYRYHAHKELVIKLLEADANPDLVNKDLKTPAHLYFEGLSSLKSTQNNKNESIFENVIRELLHNMQNVDQIDQQGWNLLHHAVYSQRLDLVEFFLKKGISPWQATMHGITSIDLAVYTRNEPICKRLLEVFGSPTGTYLSSHLISQLSENQSLIDAVSPIFFSEMAMKLQKNYWKYWYNVYQDKDDHYNTSYLPVSRVMDTLITSSTEEALRKIYLPIDQKTPMALAIESRNIKKINELIELGWNAYLEQAVVHNQADHFYDALDKIYNEKRSTSTLQNGFLFKNSRNAHNDYLAILQYLVQSPTTGISIESEFNRLINGSFTRLRGFVESQVLTLFDLGITPESFNKITGEDLQSSIYMLHFYQGERGDPDLTRLANELDNRMLTFNSKRP